MVARLFRGHKIFAAFVPDDGAGVIVITQEHGCFFKKDRVSMVIREIIAPREMQRSSLGELAATTILECFNDADG